jgi:hypothetical protein
MRTILTPVPRTLSGGSAAAVVRRPWKTIRRAAAGGGAVGLRRGVMPRARLFAALLAATGGMVLATSASAASGPGPITPGVAGHGVRAVGVGSTGPSTEISCIMSFTQSHYYYGATPSQTVTTFRWGSNGTLAVNCNGRVSGLTIDSTRTSQFEEHGTETATCTQGAGYAIATLTVPTIIGGPETLTMALQNTFTGTTFDIAGTDISQKLGDIGSWALPASSAPCPTTSPGPINDIAVEHAFQIYSLGA